MSLFSGKNKQIIFGKKLREGVDPESANYEIESENCWYENTKFDFKNLQKKCKQQEKEIERLNKIINRFKVPKEEPKAKPKRMEHLDKSCSVKYLNRILNYLSENEDVKRSNISKDCGIGIDLVNEGLLFLTKQNLAVCKRQMGMDIYNGKQKEGIHPKVD